MTDFAIALHAQLQPLAEKRVFIGTSSWKYPGWIGQLYQPQHYLTRNKLSQAKFDAHCLSEYAKTFPSVCVDASYYQLPTEATLEKLCASTPPHFRFSFKVTNIFTLKHFPNQPRHGKSAGQPNPHFLNHKLFANSFLHPCKNFRSSIGALIFEFSQFYPRDFASGREFVAALNRFLEELPKGWQYAVEIRNQTFLQPEYFATLRRHGVAHVFNSWTRMPPVLDQLALPNSQTTDFFVARFLLTPGRTYAQAVSAFTPYSATQAPDADARMAGRSLIARAKLANQPSFIYANNRLEGNALNTIKALVES